MEEITQRPTEAPAPNVIGQTHEMNGQQYIFRPARVEELDRYLSKANKGLVTASIVLAIDMAQEADRAELGALFQAQPGLAVRVANDELAARGFGTGQD